MSATRMSRSAVVLVGVGLAACGGGAEGPPPPEVGVAMPERRTVEYYAEFSGNTRAIEFAEVRARVPGTLQQMQFQPSGMVQKGQVLFVIEPEPYEAAHQEAEARLASARSELARAVSDLDRINLAIQTNAVSQQDLDRAQATRDQASAAVQSAEAQLTQATINLGYTRVRSPVNGTVSRNFVDLGNLVGVGEPTLLTTVSRVQPIWVYFDAPEQLVLQMLARQAVRRETPTQVVGEGQVGMVFVGTAADTNFPYEGRIDFIDNTVDPATGTIALRAVLPNTGLRLFPGLFVRVRVVVGQYDSTLVVSERAIGADIGGKYLLVLDDQNVVERRYVTLGPVQDGGTIVV
ncbi:MAG: efflux RND transporter periplasmic adaptor subunit, partial [Gemmatimonadota bacterium]|nr:efflux RND transporter periplasmic adaptor subunit [Gemmatimonadota bacterium]